MNVVFIYKRIKYTHLFLCSTCTFNVSVCFASSISFFVTIVAIIFSALMMAIIRIH